MIIELLLFLALLVLGLIGIILNEQLSRMNRNMKYEGEYLQYIREELAGIRRQNMYELKYTEAKVALEAAGDRLDSMAEKLQEEKHAHGMLCQKYGAALAELEKLKPKVKGGRKR